MSFGRMNTLADERGALKKQLSAQLSEIDGLRTAIGAHVSGNLPPTAVEIGHDNDVIEREINAARSALKEVETAIEKNRAAAAELEDAKEAERIKNRNLMIAAGAAIALLLLFLAAGG